jgi:hypothetical protein
MKLKRASYRAGVAWIAALEEWKLGKPEAISASDTTRLLAELFGVDEELIAIDVLKKRKLNALNAKELEENENFDFEDDE